MSAVLMRPSAERHALLAANPFPGLRAFRPGESDRFFGRRRQIDDLAERLGQVPLLAVSGASGCGKSSLVLAGLLAELARRHADELGTDWRAVVMRPGNRPIAHLAAPLAQALGGPAVQPSRLAPSVDDVSTIGPLQLHSEPVFERPPEPPATEAPGSTLADTLYGQLRLGGLGLVEVVRQSRLVHASPGARVLVVVDQFEELFRFRRMADPDEAAAFVKLLLQAAEDPGSPVSVVLTLRSDTLGSCADFRGLAEAVSRGGYLVPRLSREQRKEAICGPVALRGAQIAPRLVQRLLNDVSDDFDDLPVMQHALTRTWQHWAASGETRPIDLADYQATGGAASALNDHADEAWKSLPTLGAEGGIVERVFRALTERVAEGTEVRRPLEFSQLCAVCGAGSAEASAQVAHVVERFRRADTAFLVPGAERPLTDNPVIDISHESLIRQWRQLRSWVQAESDAATELDALVREADAQAAGQGELRHGLDLARARAWQKRHQPNAAWVQLTLGGNAEQGAARLAAVQRFLDESTRIEQAQRQRDRLRKRITRGLWAAVVLVSVGAAVVAVTLQRKARSRELVSAAVLAQAQDPVQSADLALQATELDSDNQRAEFALRQAMGALEVARTDRIVTLDAPLREARYSDDGRQLLAAGGRSVWLLDAATLAVTSRRETPAPVLKAWLLGGLVLAYTDDNRVRLVDATGKVVTDLACPGSGDAVASVAYAAAREQQPPQLATGCASGALLLWDLNERGVAARQELQPASDAGASITALGFSGDGLYLASAQADGQALVWKRGQPQAPWIGRRGGSQLRHDGAVRDIAFHPSDSTLLASAADDATARVWALDLDARALMPLLEAARGSAYVLKHDRPVLGVRFVQRADDQSSVMTRSDKRVFFWTGEQNFDARSHADWVTDANASRNGELLVSASADGTAQLWSSRSASAIALLRGHRNEVTRAIFSPQGDAVVTVSRDRTLRRWQVTRPVMLAAGQPWQLAAAIDPSGARRAVLCGEASAQQKSHCRLSPLADLATRADTEGEWLAPVATDEVSQVSMRMDGAQVLAVAASHDVYQSSKPVLWDSASRQRLKPAWLDTWRWASFAPGRPELVTVRSGEGSGAGDELAIWPQTALAGDDPGKPLWRMQLAAGSGPVQGAALSPDGRWLAAARGDQVLLFDRTAASGSPPRLLRGHSGDLRSLAFSADGRWLASGSNDRSARLWPLATPDAEPVVLDGGHAGAVTAANFSRDGQRVLTASTDATLRLWDAASGRKLAVVQRHADAVTAAMFDPASPAILSASTDGTVRFDRCDACTLPLGELRDRARQAVTLLRQADAAASAASAGR